MAELGLGVISLIGPTYHLYKRCSNLISNIRHLHGDLRRFSDKFDIQRRLYLNEWQILLSFLVEKEVAESMLEQGNAHPRWNEPDFIKAWEANMAQNFDKAIGTINATLRLLESRMENLQISAQPGGVSEAVCESNGIARVNHID